VKRLVQDLILPIVVLLALPVAMLGPALTLPLLIYGFPLVMVGLLAGLFVLLRGERRKQQGGEAPLQDLSGRPPAGGPAPEKFASAVALERARQRDSLPSAEPLGGGPFRRIMVFLNPEDFALGAMARVAATARRDCAEVILAGVVGAEETLWRHGLRGNLTHHRQLIRLRLDKELENLCWRLEENGVSASRRVELAVSATQVPDLALREGADLVVFAPSRGRLRQARVATPDWARALPCHDLDLAS
jgi:hypothetical protein